MGIFQQSHRWKVAPAEAAALQRQLAPQVIRQTPAALRRKLARGTLLIGGADISYDRGSDLLAAAIRVLCWSDGTLVATARHEAEATFPYLPGFLSFREVPPLVAAFAHLSPRPDLLLCDGQGLAHPRRLGFASHLGLLLNLPTIGCAKSRLIGTYREPASRRGSATQLISRGEVIGKVVRTRDGVRPLFVSIGHKIDLETAVSVVLHCTLRYRIPEPIRQAHEEVNRMRASFSRQ